MKDIQFNERKQHGLPDFPFQYYYINSLHPQYVMPLHWHGEFELIRVLSGSFELYLDNKPLTLNAGDSAIIDCTTMHRGTPNNAIYECVVFNISMLYKKSNDIVRKYLRPIAHKKVSVEKLPKGNTKAVINEIFDTAEKHESLYELKMHSLLFEFFLKLYEEELIKNQEKHKNTKQMEIIGELLDWIEENYTEVITLSTLSEISGLNQKYLCRFFKEYTGRTPIDYINNLRIDAACHEIEHSNMSVTEAALASGFNSISYFTKTFKRYKNMSPREYMAMK
ncbi:MAG: AraC family transcriptional regulator [Clostridia bacterium]|nr:AraC family transcriptional regulator [Clostridia bacterium]